jgi:hypothetical protein
MDMVQSTGDWVVGLDFNPSNSDKVAVLKKKAADFITECEDQAQALYKEYNNNEVQAVGDAERHGEQISLLERAAETVEIAAMLAVKAVTKQNRK